MTCTRLRGDTGNQPRTVALVGELCGGVLLIMPGAGRKGAGARGVSGTVSLCGSGEGGSDLEEPDDVRMHQRVHDPLLAHKQVLGCAVKAAQV